MAYSRYHSATTVAALTEAEEWRVRQLYDNLSFSSTGEDILEENTFYANNEEGEENAYSKYEVEDTEHKEHHRSTRFSRAPKPAPELPSTSQSGSQDPTLDYTGELHKILLLPDGPERRKQLVCLFDLFYSAAEEGLTAIAAGMLKKGNFGGQAGGVKFTWKGVFFKRAEDSEIRRGFYLYGGRYGPSNYFSGKAASNELKASNTLFRQFYNKGTQIILPLQILFDFHGERVLAMSLLPLKGSKLVYGSNDSGRTVHNDDPDFDRMITSVADELHLAAHVVKAEKSSTTLHLAGDVEGHAVDGKFFLLDLARMWPPEAPLRGPPTSIFFRLMRPEFLQYLSKKGFPALSPDALARWGGDEENVVHNQNVRAATALLLQERIPEWVKQTETSIVEDAVRWEKLIWSTCSTELQAEIRRWLEPIQDKMGCPADWLQPLNFLVLRWFYLEKRPLSTAEWDPVGLLSHNEWVKRYGNTLSSLRFRLSSSLHSFGIPVRHLSKVLELTTLPELQELIQLEMIARATKSRIRFLLRADDSSDAFALADRIDKGSLTEDDCTILEAISKDKYGVKLSNFGELAKTHGPAIAGYVQETCGLKPSTSTSTSTSTSGQSICVPRRKPNSFLGLVRATVHLDNAMGHVWLVGDCRGTTKEASSEVVAELRAAKTLAESVLQSDPNDDQAQDLATVCSRLLDLSQLRGLTVFESRRATQSHAGLLKWWLALLHRREVREIGVHMIGDRRTAFHMAAWFGLDRAPGAEELHYWTDGGDRPEISPTVVSALKDLVDKTLGLKGAAVDMAVAAHLHFAMVYNAYARNSVSCHTLNHRSKALVGQGRLNNHPGDCLVVRNPDKENGWLSKDTDGGPGSVGHVVRVDFDDDGAKCYVDWLPLAPSRRGLMQIIGENGKFELLKVDDEFLALLASTDGPTALADLVERQKDPNKFPLNQDKASLARVKGSEQQEGREVRLEEVEEAQTQMWVHLAEEVRGRYPVVTGLLAPHHIDQAKEGPLVITARAGYRHGTELLLKCGASVQGSDKEQRTALHYAVENGWTDIAQVLLEKGCPASQLDCNGKLALHVACTHNLLPIAEMLVPHASLDSPCNFKRTPLHYCVDKGATSCVQLMLKHKANPNSPDEQKATPLHLAAERGEVPIMQLLIRAKAKVDLRMTTGETCLHRAARAGKIDACALLLRNHADPNAETLTGAKPHTITNAIVGNLPRDTMLEAVKQVGKGVVGRINYDMIVNDGPPPSKEQHCVLQ